MGRPRGAWAVTEFLIIYYVYVCLAKGGPTGGGNECGMANHIRLVLCYCKTMQNTAKPRNPWCVLIDPRIPGFHIDPQLRRGEFTILDGVPPYRAGGGEPGGGGACFHQTLSKSLPFQLSQRCLGAAAALRGGIKNTKFNVCFATRAPGGPEGGTGFQKVGESPGQIRLLLQNPIVFIDS